MSDEYVESDLNELDFNEFMKFRINSNKDYETGLTRDERILLNKMITNYLEKLDENLYQADPKKN